MQHKLILLISRFKGDIFKWEQRVIEKTGTLIWSQILMELTFNPCGEFR